MEASRRGEVDLSQSQRTANIGRNSHGSVTEVHKMIVVIERFLDGSAFFVSGSLSG